MRQLYPAIEPLLQHSIPVQIPHVLHVEECGRLHGIPVVFLHGGPGAGCTPTHRRFFDPDRYRIILIDQRGAGRSTPHASLENNTTRALMADMEALREYLGIEQWALFGGSWGSTLALLYAEAHPERVLGLILRGIFLCRTQEIQWFYQDGAHRIFPDYWEEYLRPIPPEERDDMLGAYYRRLTGNDDIARLTAAKSWSLWEGRAATLRPSKGVLNHFGDTHTALSLARIEAHYFIHNAFLRDNQILEEAGRLKDIPGYIVHGRYDMICPMENAWQLHRAWPRAQLSIIADAGHSASEPGMVDALVRATRHMAEELAPA